MDNDQIREAFNETRRLISSANWAAKDAVDFAAGRLQRLYIKADTLRRLKAELTRFNSHTGKWK